jgi:hypothetical protein
MSEQYGPIDILPIVFCFATVEVNARAVIETMVFEGVTASVGLNFLCQA